MLVALGSTLPGRVTRRVAAAAVLVVVMVAAAVGVALAAAIAMAMVLLAVAMVLRAVVVVVPPAAGLEMTSGPIPTLPLPLLVEDKASHH
jgi:hypothetical protein